MNEKANNIFAEILNERTLQDAKFGPVCGRDYGAYTWMAVLSEEVGEVAQAILKRGYEGGESNSIREELIQVAAVAVAMIEAFDCGKL